MFVIIGLCVIHPLLCLIGLRLLFVGNPTNARYFQGRRWRYNFLGIHYRILCLAMAVCLTVTIPLAFNYWPSWRFFYDLYNLRINLDVEVQDPELEQHPDPEIRAIGIELRAIHNQNTDGYVRSIKQQIQVDHERDVQRYQRYKFNQSFRPGTGIGTAFLLFVTIMWIIQFYGWWFIRNRLRYLEAQGYNVGDTEHYCSQENTRYCQRG